jgi:hypothetical protein
VILRTASRDSPRSQILERERGDLTIPLPGNPVSLTRGRAGTISSHPPRSEGRIARTSRESSSE